jgi:hypothetical protein
MRDLTEFVPDPKDPDHVDAMFALLPPTATLRQAQALAECAAERGITFRELAYLLNRAWKGCAISQRLLDGFIRRGLRRLE